MGFDLTLSGGWESLSQNMARMAGPSGKKALQRCAAAALSRIKEHWVPGGGVPPWAAYSPAYAKRKAAGSVVPGRQVSTSATPDNILTDALRQSAVFEPIVHFVSWHSIVVTPRGEMQRGKLPVKDYMGHVYARRPFYGLNQQDMDYIARQFAVGMLNALHGVPDVAGAHLVQD
jgi:hypothetical protein